MQSKANDALVSVVIPAYNCGRYIGEALDSVLKQTYRNFEIVLVDDGSTDDTKEALAPYYDRINYFYQENRGLASARNTGLMKAKGEYFALLDADDIWLPHKLEWQLKCLDMFPAIGILFSDFSSFNADGVIAFSWSKKYFDTIFKNYKLTLDTIFQQKHRLDNYCMIYAGDISNTMFLGNIVMPSTVLIKRECIDKLGMFQEKYRNDSDYDLFLRITSNFRSGYLDAPLMKYRILENSLSMRSKKAMVGVFEVVDIIEKFIKDRPCFAHNGVYGARQRFSGLFYEAGYGYFSRNNFKDAQRYFIKSIKFHPLPLASLKVYIYLLVSLFPRSFIVLAKYWKKFFAVLVFLSSPCEFELEWVFCEGVF